MRRLDALLGALAVLSMVLFLVAAAALGASWKMSDSMPIVAPEAVAFTEIPAALPCGTEDSRSWVWSRCGNSRRGALLHHDRQVVVTCEGFRYLAHQGALDLRATPVLRGDWSCGR
jgi:hypothetical protein